MELDIFYTVHFLEINNFSWENDLFITVKFKKVNDRKLLLFYFLSFGSLLTLKQSSSSL